MHSNMCTGQDMFVRHVWYENSGMSDISYVVSSGVFGVRHSSDQCFEIRHCKTEMCMYVFGNKVHSRHVVLWEWNPLLFPVHLFTD